MRVKLEWKIRIWKAGVNPPGPFQGEMYFGFLYL